MEKFLDALAQYSTYNKCPIKANFLYYSCKWNACSFWGPSSWLIAPAIHMLINHRKSAWGSSSPFVSEGVGKYAQVLTAQPDSDQWGSTRNKGIRNTTLFLGSLFSGCLQSPPTTCSLTLTIKDAWIPYSLKIDVWNARRHPHLLELGSLNQ